MSSRNQYLSPEERRRALSINQGLRAAEAELARGTAESDPLLAIVREHIDHEGLLIDYVAAVDPLTLQPVRRVAGPTILAVAARVGSTRLIDNIRVG